MCHELDLNIEKLSKYFEVDDALNQTNDTAFWIKDKNFKFVRYNQGMLKMLYPKASSNDLYGLTDWEYAKKQGLSDKEVEYIRNCCRLSDEYVLNSKQHSARFYEKCQAVGGNSMWLLTTKAKFPPECDKESCLGTHGTAIIYPEAEIIIKSGLTKLKKLSDSCFLLEE